MPKYKGFMKNSKKILNITTDPEVVFSTDLIYCRLALAFAYLKSIKFESANIRKAIHDFSVQSDLIKKTTDKIVQAALRTHRLVRHERLVFQGLKSSIRIYEINPTTVRNVDLLMKVNLASILIVKSFIGTVSPEKMDFMNKLAKSAYLKIVELKKFFNVKYNAIFDGILEFLDIAEIFYRCFLLYTVLRLNLFEDAKLINRTKDFKLAYVENKDISKEIPKTLDALKTRKFNSKDDFNVEENRRFCLAFFDNFGKSIFTE